MRPLFKISRPVILASASPRRKDFLAGLGLEFQVLPALASEPVCGPGEFPGDFTMRSAALKARDAFSRLDGKVKSLLPAVIGADTVVTLNEMVMGKPQDEAEALDMLRSLAGKIHTVYTGCSCLFVQSPDDADGFQEVCFYRKSEVQMHDFSDDVLKAYIGTGEPMDKAGAYAIQGSGAFLIRKINGSWTNIVGLPLDELVNELLDKGVIVPNTAGLE